ncbi:MAG: NAD-dependent epimerase/dehydratase family protein [Acidimicrobiia bacterium]|nr:NAD-dependent epimerase/dehydratase family protein [Acidimicrobiia bacterium]
MHLAGRAHVSTNASDDQIYKTVNTDLTETLAKQMAKTNKHMIFVSTSVIYGNKAKMAKPLWLATGYMQFLRMQVQKLRPKMPCKKSACKTSSLTRSFGHRLSMARV